MASNSAFKIQRGSRAIPIIAPATTGSEQAPTVVKSPPKQPTPPSAALTATSLTAPNISLLRYSKDNERDDWAYDVYAQPYVPQGLKLINSEPAKIINTETKHELNYATYIQTFAGSHFLTRSVLPTARQVHSSGLESLGTHNYENYFRYHYSIEVEALRKEYDSYALYKVPLGLVDYNSRLCSLLVPGLREDSPHIEMGDIIQLRQLRFDVQGNPLNMNFWLQHNTVSSHRAPCPAFTGSQYNASVWGINRASETLFLRVDGLVPESMVFNATFPVKERRIQALLSGLTTVQENLHNATRIHTLDDHIQLCQKVVTSLLPQEGLDGIVDGMRDNQNHVKNDWIRRMLFPVESDSVLQTKLHTIPYQRKMFDARLNYEQLKAVDTVCRNDYGVLPFLISGPPGTGKTKTLVETALQLLSTTKVVHILICAPSDPAADTLALRLRDNLKPGELFRLNGPSRTIPEVPEALLPYCHIENDKFSLPTFVQLMKTEIVVTSSRDAAILANARVTNTDLYALEAGLLAALHPNDPSPRMSSLHWGALLMDEAAQATELESLLPLTVVLPPANSPLSPQFIMAGDENQLGPRTSSKSPVMITSLFERLFARPIYTTHPLSRNKSRPYSHIPILTKTMLPMPYPTFVNLIRNYRSHPAILSVPSSLFYNDTLIPEATAPITSPLLSWRGWQGRRWPVLFRINKSLDEIEQDAGGWYNPLEARIACELAVRLITEKRIQQRDICIMSPFSAQVRVLRNLMRSGELGGSFWEVNIGPMEAFQGLESQVVILCTTRTRTRFLNSDAHRNLGIVNQPKRLNVALTRAKEGLIVIGNPELLHLDPNWSAFLAMCHRNGLYIGEGSDAEGMAPPYGQEGKIGLLENALLRKEKEETESRGKVERALGDGAIRVEDEMWAAGLRQALEEEQEGMPAFEDGEDEYAGNDEDNDETDDEKSEGDVT